MSNKIKKAPGSATNSFVLEVKGMSVRTKSMDFQSIKASVIFTSDSHGETLSVYDPSTKKQIQLPFEPLEELIERARKARRDIE